MKKSKRLLCWVLVIIMITATVAGCSDLYADDNTPTASAPEAATDSGGESSSGDTDTAAAPSGAVPELASVWPEFSTPREAQIVCFEMGWTGPDPQRDFLTAELAARTNFLLKYEPMTLVTGDDLIQQLNLMVAGGDIPEIYFCGTGAYERNIYTSLGQVDKLWNMMPILHDYEYINDLLAPELILYRDDPDTIFFVPTQTGRGNDMVYGAPHGPFAREDWLEILGMDSPRSIEEFYDYLVRARDEIVEVDGLPVIGFTLGENLGGIDGLIFPFFPFKERAAYDIIQISFDISNNYRVMNYGYTDSDEFMRAAKFINRLFREGLIDRDSLTATTAQASQKVSQGRVAAHSSNVWEMNNNSDNARAIVPDIMYATMNLFDRANGMPPDIEWTNGVFSWSALTLSTALDEDTVRHFVAMLDYLTTLDGQILTQYGIEGRSFYYDEDGYIEFTDEFKVETDDLDWNKVAATGVWYWQQLVFNLPAFDHLRRTYPELERADNMRSWENISDRRYDLYNADMMPTKDYYFTPGPIEQEKMPAISDARLEMLLAVLTAPSESAVEQVVHDWAETCRRLGIDDIINERQTWIDNFDINQ